MAKRTAVGIRQPAPWQPHITKPGTADTRDKIWDLMSIGKGQCFRGSGLHDVLLVPHRLTLEYDEPTMYALIMISQHCDYTLLKSEKANWRRSMLGIIWVEHLTRGRWRNAYPS